MSQKEIPSEMRDAIMQHGIRNALLTSIAPTGTISMYAGNVSSGIEPVFAARYNRKVLKDDGVTKVEQMVEDYGVLLHREWCENTGRDVEPNPEHLVTAQTLTPNDHLVMQAAVQKWIDSSISKTINCPVDISFEDFKEIYMEAYRLGCKGCTTYRPNDTLGSVISVIDNDKGEPEKEEGPQPPATITVTTPDRDPVLTAKVYKLKWKNSNVYVTISDQWIDGKLSPFEIFINTQDMSNFQYIVALTRMMSSVMRRGGDISFVIEDLKSIMDPNGGEFVGGRYQPSFMAYLGQTLAHHIDGLYGTTQAFDDLIEEVIAEDQSNYLPEACPECKAFAMVNRGGCPVCEDCGHSKCG